jgi:2',3'-cyclic-nucleotide 2'-phosphodiesterase (5'-nucleotidase family)
MRKGPTNLGKLIAKSISASAPQAELALLNSGSVRIDDQLQGTISQYDILRALPFGGKIVEADIQGNLLEKILTTGAKNAGNGGYLQTDKVEYDMVRQTWLIGGKLLDTNKTYRVALSDYLITGLESNFGFLKAGNQNILKIYEPNATDKLDLRNDIRSAVIAYLKSLNK